MKSLKFLLSLTALLLWGAVAKAQFNPPDPPDPGMPDPVVKYTLSVKCVPEDGGSINTYASQVVEPGKSITLRAYPETGFNFLGWYDSDNVLLYSGTTYNYTMPYANVNIVAKFEFNPDDPSEPPYVVPVETSKVTLSVNPTAAGEVYGGGTFVVGETTSVRTYNNTGFRFLNWTKDGEVISTSTSFTYTVEKGNPNLVANYVFDPDNPQDPSEPRFPHYIYLKLNPANADIYLSGGGAHYTGDNVRIYSSQDQNFTLINWTDEEGNVYSTSREFNLTMPDHDLTLTANFRYTPSDPANPGVPDIPTIAPNTVERPRFVMEGIDHVVILCETDNAEIHYTIDGTDPDENSPLYTGPVFVGSNLLVKAIAYLDGMYHSPIGIYQVTSYRSAPPVYTFVDGKIALSCATPGAIIRYTTDFSEPNEESEVYTEPFVPEENCRIKAYSSYEGLTDSEVSIFVYRRRDFTVPTPEFTLYEDDRLVISTSMADATIYYTTDGSDPTRESILYTGPITPPQNKLYKAIGVKENRFDSEIGQIDLRGLFPVATPTATYSGKHIILSCEDGNASILYTTDGTDPLQGTTYTEPIPVSGDVTIRFIAIQEGFSDSEEVTYNFVLASHRMPKPVLNPLFTRGVVSLTHPLSNQRVKIEITDKEGSVSEQTVTTPYELPVEVSMAQIVATAIGNEEFFDSESVGYTISVNETPTFSVNGDGKVVISSATPEVTLYYTVDGSDPTASSSVYSEPLSITEALTLKAIAVKEDSFNSAIGELQTASVLVEDPVITFSQRNVVVTCPTEDVEIHYTLDGSEPTKESPLYSGPFLPASDCTVTVKAFKNEWIPSKTANYNYVKANVTAYKPAATPDYTGRTIRLTHRVASQPLKLTVTMADGTTTEVDAVSPYEFAVEEGMINLSVVADGGEDWFDSEALEFPITVVVTPNFYVDEDGLVVIESATPEVSIYYTLDGEQPSTASQFYTGPLAITEILTVKAYAVKENCFDSAVGEFPTEPVLIKKPTIVFSKRNVVMACETEGVQIRYTEDGSEPTKVSALYEGPFLPAADCTVTAKAFRSGFIPSPVESYEYVLANVTTKNPEAAYDYPGHLIRLTHPVDGQQLNLTVTSKDGNVTNQTVTAPHDFNVELGMTNLAVVAHTNDDWFDSETLQLPITVIATPTFFVNEDGLVVIESTTPEVSIYYTLDGTQPSTASQLYNSPLTITESLTVKAYAVKENCFDSAVGEFPTEPVLIKKPTVTFSQRNVVMACETEGVQIRYTEDGSEPTKTSALYEGPFLPAADCTVIAKAFRSGFIPSPVESYEYVLANVTTKNPEAAYDYPGHVIRLTHPVDGQQLNLAVTSEDGSVTNQTVNAPYDFNVELGMTNLAVVAHTNDDWFDSETLQLPITVIATPTFSVNEDGLVVIESATPEVSIYYTLDGTQPSTTSQLYDGPLSITESLTVKAYAVKENCFDSAVGEFPTEPVLIKKPTIVFSQRNVVMACETEGVQIRYTEDGSEPTKTSALYEGPFLPAADCTVTAKAFRSGFIPSPVESYEYVLANVTTKNPEAVYDYPGHMIHLTHPVDGQQLNLTVTSEDGSVTNQTVNAPYDFNVELGMTNLAVVAHTNDDWFDSETLQLPITVITTPTFSVNEDGLVVIESATPEVSIYYTLDGEQPSTASQLYNGPLSITESLTVKAYAVKDNCFDSAIGEFPTEPVLIKKPTIAFSQRNVVMACETEGVQIRYTEDGSEPTKASSLYEGPFLPAADCTVTAKAFRSGFIPSKTESYQYVLANVTTKAPEAEIDYPGHVIRLTHPVEGQQLNLTLSREQGQPTEQTVNAPHNFNVELGMTNLSVVAHTNDDWFDSEALQIPITVIETPVFYVNEDGLVVISSDTPEVTIRYTLDGSEPNANSEVYNGPLNISEDVTVKAYAVKADCFDSAIGQFPTAPVLIAKPTVVFTKRHIEMACETEGVQIRYTEDGSEPTKQSSLYEGPFLPAADCTVTAKAFRSGFIPSKTESYDYVLANVTTKAPEAEIDYPGHVIRLTHPVEGQQLNLTLSREQGQPTEQTVNAPHDFNVELGMTNLSVVAHTNDDWFDSEALQIPITVIDAPYFLVNEDGLVEIHCDTPGVTILYAINDEPLTSESKIYRIPLNITDDVTVKAYAVKADCFDSAIGQFPTAPVLIAKPTVVFTKRHIEMGCATDGVQIYYTEDGTVPTKESEPYNGPFLPSKDCKVTAKAFRSGFIPSPTESYDYVLANVTAQTPQAECDYPGHVIRLSHPVDGQPLKLTLSREQGAPTEQTVNAPYDFQVEEGMTALEIIAIAPEDWFDSAPVNVPITVLDTPTFSINANGEIEMATVAEGTSIRYTIDGNRPTPQSAEFNAPIFNQEGVTVMAYALKEECFDSAVGTFETAPFVLATPAIDIENQLIYITSSDEDAELRYTLNAQDPIDDADAEVYNEPFLPEQDCMICAQAFREGYIPSKVAEYRFDIVALTLPTPASSYGAKHLTLSTEIDGATIRYSYGEEDPAAGEVYDSENPIEFIQQDATVCFIATHPKRLNSAPGRFDFVAADYTAKAPEITTDFAERKITVAHEDAEQPLAITVVSDNGQTAEEGTSGYTLDVVPGMTRFIVKAADTAELFASEEVEAEINFNEAPTLSFDGYDFKVDVDGDYDASQEVMLQINSEDPIMVTPGYSDHLALTGIIKGETFSAAKFRSEPTELTINAWFDGNEGATAVAGTFNEALQWCGTELNPEIAIAGPLNAADFATLREHTGIRHLDLSSASIEEALPEKAFAGTEIISVTMPQAVTSLEADAFAGAAELSAIIWQAENAPEANAFSAMGNPNALLFTEAANAPESTVGINVVKAGEIERLDLKDGYPFYTPMEFTADSVSFVRDFFQLTLPDDVRGWESIALPFTPTEITHAINGLCAPFADKEAVDNGAKPFWLYTMTDEYAFEAADHIEAYLPYIISMPNNEEYADRFILGGEITFKAGESVIQPTPRMPELAAEVSFFRENLGNAASNLNVSTDSANHNIEEIVGDAIYGSKFIPALRRLRPFEGYFRDNTGGENAPRISIRDALSDIVMPTVGTSAKDGVRIFVENGHVTLISDADRTVVIADMTGKVMRNVETKAGIMTDAGSLAPGTYIIANQKIMIR